jgi:hypothetical protein
MIRPYINLLDENVFHNPFSNFATDHQSFSREIYFNYDTIFQKKVAII